MNIFGQVAGQLTAFLSYLRIQRSDVTQVEEQQQRNYDHSCQRKDANSGVFAKQYDDRAEHQQSAGEQLRRRLCEQRFELIRI